MNKKQERRINKLRKRSDKPHLRIIEKKGIFSKGYYLWPTNINKNYAEGLLEKIYCKTVNPIHYGSPGDAARALHYREER